MDTGVFEELDQNDILFIDSSHVSKTGSDVNHLLFDVLPRLRKGVLVHFHDVFYPFEYPATWAYRGYAWNEDYCLRAFLSFNSCFEILLFTSFLGCKHRDVLTTTLPKSGGTGSSLWIRKIQ